MSWGGARGQILAPRQVFIRISPLPISKVRNIRAGGARPGSQPTLLWEPGAGHMLSSPVPSLPWLHRAAHRACRALFQHAAGSLGMREQCQGGISWKRNLVTLQTGPLLPVPGPGKGRWQAGSRTGFWCCWPGRWGWKSPQSGLVFTTAKMGFHFLS